MIANQISQYTGECIVDTTGRYSFNDLSNQIALYRKALTVLHKNDVVIIDSDYHFYSIALLLSLSEIPCIIVPLVKTNQEEFDVKVAASGANVVIHFDDHFKEKISRIISDNQSKDDYGKITSAGHSGIVLFSSGITGKPKVMVHDFTVLIQTFEAPRRQKSLRFLLFLMFDHIGGLNTLLSCLNNGSPIIVPVDRNPVTILALIEKEKVQVLPTSPTFLNLMLMVENFDQYNLSSLKMITYGTERMPEGLLIKINQFMPGVKFLQTFGTSETGIMKTQSKSSSSLYFKIVDEDVEYRIEAGQLFIKSKTVVKGYRGMASDKFTEDGWFATGDLVDVDSEGYMKIVGRMNDVINVGGLKVLPSEVENIINTVEGVIDSTVYATNNSITGQMVCASVVIDKEADSSGIKSAILKTCKERLEKYKVPVKIVFNHNIISNSRFKKTM